jgi:hypothetical protein
MQLDLDEYYRCMVSRGHDILICQLREEIRNTENQESKVQDAKSQERKVDSDCQLGTNSATSGLLGCRVSEGRYHMVACVYGHGIMHGEAVSPRDISTEIEIM